MELLLRHAITGAIGREKKILTARSALMTPYGLKGRLLDGELYIVMKITLYEAIAYTLLGIAMLILSITLSGGTVGFIIVGSLLSSCYLIPGISFWVIWWKERKYK